MRQITATMARMINHRLFLPIAFLLGACLRIGWIAFFDVSPMSDCSAYFQLATRIADGKSYSLTGLPSAFWPVGYPGFLGLLFMVFGKSVLVAQIANIVMALGAAGAVYGIGRLITKSEPASRIACALMIFHVNGISYSALTSVEIYFLFLTVVAILFHLLPGRKTWHMVPAGLLWGAAILVKLQVIFLPVCLICYTGLMHRSKVRVVFLRAAIVYACIAPAVCGWMFRNYATFGVPFLMSTNGGFMLILGNNPLSDGTYTGNDPATRELISKLIKDKNEAEADEALRAYAIHYALSHPFHALLVWPKKLFFLYKSDNDGINWNLGGLPETHVFEKNLLLKMKYVCFVNYLAMFLLVLAGFRRLERLKMLGIPIMAILYYSVMYTIFIGSTRYHFPTMPFIAICAGLALSDLLVPATKNAPEC